MLQLKLIETCKLEYHRHKDGGYVKTGDNKKEMNGILGHLCAHIG